MTERKSVLLRLDAAVHDALAKWASDALRSTNAQIELLLRRARRRRAAAAPGQCGPAAAHPPPAAPEPARRPAMTSPGEVMTWMRAGESALQRQHDHVVAVIDLEPGRSLRCVCSTWPSLPMRLPPLTCYLSK